MWHFLASSYPMTVALPRILITPQQLGENDVCAAICHRNRYVIAIVRVFATSFPKHAQVHFDILLSPYDNTHSKLPS